MVGLRLKLMLAASCLTPPLLIAPAAAAQSEIEEVIVTASRREEALAKAPVSVAAYTRKAMDERGKGAAADTASGEAETFLREALADGPRPSKDVEEEAREAHRITSRTLDRARTKLGVIARPEVLVGPNGRSRRVWTLSLPGSEGRQERQERQEETSASFGGEA